MAGSKDHRDSVGLDEIAQIFDKLYDSERLELIGCHLPSLQCPDKLFNQLRNSIFRYIYEIYNRDYTDAGTIRKNLKSAARALSQAQKKLANLEGGARDAIALAIRDAAAQRAQERAKELKRRQEENPSPDMAIEPAVNDENIEVARSPNTVSPFILDRLSITENNLREVEILVRAGLDQVSKLKPRGRPSNDAERSLITYLHDIWITQTKSEPTAHNGGEGPFTDFCRAVVEPLWRDLGLDAPKLSGQVQEVLYPGDGN